MQLNMKSNFSILVGLLAFFNISSSYSQVDSIAVSFTLEEAIGYAFENNDSIKNSILEQQISKARVGEIRADGLPQISGNASLSKSYIIPVQLLPAQFIDPDAREGEFAPVQFSPAYVGNASVELRQLIFDGSYFVGLKAANTYQELSTKAAIKTKIDVVEAVSKSYYAALIAQERIVLAEENFRRLDTLLRETKIMYENGFSEKIDVSRINVQYNNAKVDRKKAERAIQISFYLLKFQMGMPIDQLIYIEDNLGQVALDFDKKAFDDFKYSNRIEYSQLQTNQTLAELDLKNSKVQYLPKMDVFINLAANMGTNSSENIFDFSNSWFGNGAFGATLSLPIFDGLRKSYLIQQNKLTLQQLDNSFNALKNSIDLGIVQSKINLENNLETLESYSENMELAREVTEVAKIKYQEGVGSNIEVVDAEIAYQEAETNYFDALYDAIVAKVELEKAFGILLD